MFVCVRVRAYPWQRAPLRARFALCLQLLQLLLFARQRHRRVIVQALRHQLQRQRILVARRLLDFGPLVLEPDLDLGLVQAQFAAQLLAPPFG